MAHQTVKMVRTFVEIVSDDDEDDDVVVLNKTKSVPARVVTAHHGSPEFGTSNNAAKKERDRREREYKQQQINIANAQLQQQIASRIAGGTANNEHSVSGGGRGSRSKKPSSSRGPDTNTTRGSNGEINQTRTKTAGITSAPAVADQHNYLNMISPGGPSHVTSQFVYPQTAPQYHVAGTVPYSQQKEQGAYTATGTAQGGGATGSRDNSRSGNNKSGSRRYPRTSEYSYTNPNRGSYLSTQTGSRSPNFHPGIYAGQHLLPGEFSPGLLPGMQPVPPPGAATTANGAGGAGATGPGGTTTAAQNQHAAYTAAINPFFHPAHMMAMYGNPAQYMHMMYHGGAATTSPDAAAGAPSPGTAAYNPYAAAVVPPPGQQLPPPGTAPGFRPGGQGAGDQHATAHLDPSAAAHHAHQFALDPYMMAQIQAAQQQMHHFAAADQHVVQDPFEQLDPAATTGEEDDDTTIDASGLTAAQRRALEKQHFGGTRTTHQVQHFPSPLYPNKPAQQVPQQVDKRPTSSSSSSAASGTKTTRAPSGKSSPTTQQDGAAAYRNQHHEPPRQQYTPSVQKGAGKNAKGGKDSTAIWPITGPCDRHVRRAEMKTPPGYRWTREQLIWHGESLRMGRLDGDSTIFIKGKAYNDLLSTLSEDRIRHQGRHRYCIRFREKTDGDNEEGFSMADGIGFVFSNKLPCAKNIQRIQSIFVSRKGIVCVRRKADVTRCKEFVVRPFEHGDFIWCEIDLTMGTAAFWVEGPETEGYTNGPPQEKVFYYGDCFPQFARGKLDMGFITAVIKFEGVAADAVCYQNLVPEAQ